MMDVSGDAKVLSTAAIVAPTVDEGAVTLEGGSAADLFAGENVVTVKPAADQAALALPIELDKATEMQEISITTPNGTGAIQAGTALVELEDGSTMTVPLTLPLRPASTPSAARPARAL